VIELGKGLFIFKEILIFSVGVMGVDLGNALCLAFGVLSDVNVVLKLPQLLNELVLAAGVDGSIGLVRS